MIRVLRRHRQYVAYALVVAASSFGIYLGAHNSAEQHRRDVAAARASLVQAKESCRRAQLGIPTLVKALRIIERAQTRVPDFIPREYRITAREIRFYEDLRPARC